MIIILFPFLSYFHKLRITAAATIGRKRLSSSAPAGLASVLLITFAIRCLHVYDSLSWLSFAWLNLVFHGFDTTIFYGGNALGSPDNVGIQGNLS
ncbi:hypothetical protein SLE2022_142400 [Rubroshorea leprosula]